MKTPIALAVYASTLALLAGCGSSATSTAGSSAASATPAAASTQAAGGSSYSHYGPSTSASPAAPATTGAAAGSPTGGPTVVLSKRAKLGTILAAGPKHMTVSLFEADTSHASACSGACASVWPPVTASAASAGPGALAAALGTIARADGTKQVTYNGHPLYFFAQDKDMGDAYGQGVKGFGSDWYVLRPNGSKLDKS